jgi:serine phosphatase RsbU (regulator of sigma subunit)
MPLGTLWMFCTRPRDFTDQQTNLVEIIAGRLAADLEREVLLREGTTAKESERQLAAAAQRQADQLPQMAPVVDGWQVAGRTQQGDQVGGALHDWFVLRDGNLAAAAGIAQGEPLAAAMTTATISSALKAHAEYPHKPRQMLQRVGETLWASGAGDLYASLAYVVVEPETGCVGLAGTGRVEGLILRSDGFERIRFGQGLLGSDPDPTCRAARRMLSKGDVLLLLTDGVPANRKGQTRAKAVKDLCETLQKHRHEPAERIVSLVQQTAAHGSPGGRPKDQTMLVIRRTELGPRPQDSEATSVS